MSATGPNGAVTVLAADSSSLTLLGLSQTISRSPRLVLTGRARDGDSAISAIRAEPPQIAIVDAFLERVDGCEIARIVRAEQLPTRVLIIAERHTGDIVLRAVAAGAAGFISKRARLDAILDALQRVADGQSVLPAEVGAAVAKVLTSRGSSDYLELTERELEVLSQISLGQTAALIGQELEISSATVKTHIQTIYMKLGVNDRAAAVSVAIHHGLLT